MKLNDKQVKSLLRKGEVGRHAAGNGFYLRISNEPDFGWFTTPFLEDAGKLCWGLILV